MRLIVNERSAGEDREAFLSGVVRETDENVRKWLAFSGLSEKAAGELFKREERFSFAFRQEEQGAASVTIRREDNTLAGEPIVYAPDGTSTLDEWAMDVSLILLYLAANYGGGAFAEGVRDFLTDDTAGLMPFLSGENFSGEST